MDIRDDGYSRIVDDALSIDVEGRLANDFATRVAERSRLSAKEDRMSSSIGWWFGMAMIATVVAAGHVFSFPSLYFEIWNDLAAVTTEFRLDLVAATAASVAFFELLARKLRLDTRRF